MILLRFVVFSLLARPSAGGIVQLIETLLVNSTCPGIVLYGKLELEENVFNRPVIFLSAQQEQADREMLCVDAVISIENMTQFLPIYRRLQGFYYLNKVIAVTESIELTDAILKETQDERVSVLFQQLIIKWTVSDRIIRFPYFENNFQQPNLDNFHGRRLKAATLHYPPAVVVRRDGVIDGIEPSILNLIANQLNFTFDFVLASADEMWGDILTDDDNNGSVRLRYTGIRGMLVRKEVDLAFGDLYMHPTWLPFHSFTQVYKTDFDCFIVPAPRPMARWMALVTPFTWQTWTATLTAFIIVLLSSRSSFLFVLGQLLWVQQPRPTGNAPSTGRLVLTVFWLFTATVLPTIYRSGLISFLTRPPSNQPVDTVQQLVESPLKKIMFTDFYKSVLLNSTDPYRRKLGQQLVTSHNMSHMISLLDTGDWAMDSSLDFLRYLTRNYDPAGQRFHLMKERLFSTRSSFGIQKDSPLKRSMDGVIQRLIEAGLVEYHRPDKIASPTVNDGRLVRFSLDNLQGAFYLLAIGIIIATTAFVIELTIAKCIFIYL